MALEIIEVLLGITDEMISGLLAEAENLDAHGTPEGEYQEQSLDAYAADLAGHAQQAQHADNDPDERGVLERRGW